MVPCDDIERIYIWLMVSISYMDVDHLGLNHNVVVLNLAKDQPIMLIKNNGKKYLRPRHQGTSGVRELTN